MMQRTGSTSQRAGMWLGVAALAAFAAARECQALPFTIADGANDQEIASSAVCALDRFKRGVFFTVFSSGIPGFRGVFGRYVNRVGPTPDPLVQLEPVNPNNPRWPAVTYFNESNMLAVVWIEAGGGWRVLAAGLYGFEAPWGGTLTVHEHPPGPMTWGPPDIAYVGRNRFLVAWEEGNGVAQGIWVSRVLRDGTFTAAREISPELDARNPSIAPIGNGYSVVAWQGSTGGSDSFIRARVVGPDGAPVAAAVRLSGPRVANTRCRRPRIAAGWRPGHALAVWERVRPAGYSLMGAHLFARPDGMISVGTPFVVREEDSEDQRLHPCVVWDHAAKAYHVVWAEQNLSSGWCFVNALAVRPRRPPAGRMVRQVGSTSSTTYAWPAVACETKTPTTYTNPVMVVWSWTNNTGNLGVMGNVFETGRPVRWNDCNGDSVSDLAAYQPATGKWFVRSPRAGGYVWNGKVWGNAGMTPLTGNYDGRRGCDLTCFERATGNWYLRHKSPDGNWPDPAPGENWGDTATSPVVGDYDGDGRWDLGLYEAASGRWFILPAFQPFPDRRLAYMERWGGSGLVTVPGDYDGDHAFDLAVWQPASGNWFIRSLTPGSAPLAFGLNWGNASMVPVPGDYDGDGIWDLALCQKATGNWFIRSLYPTDAPIAFGLNWGGAWGDPVPGDYDGDGIYDLAVYERATGKWFIRKVGAGAPIVFGMTCGGPGFEPVGVCR